MPLDLQLPPLKTHKDELDTPSLCVDLDRMERNIKRLSRACHSQGIAWRPHSKCHKSSTIANKLIAAGAIGVTCAKLGEAEVMAAGGVRDILIANMVVGPHKLRRVGELCQNSDPILCSDHVDQVAALSEAMVAAGQTVRVIVDVNIGMNRTGVTPGKDAVALAQEIDRLPSLKLSGIMGYEGHLLLIENQTEKAEKIAASLDQLTATRDSFLEHGLNCEIVSCGGTGSFEFSAQHPGITELQAGGGIFMDDFYHGRCHVSRMEFALTMVATIVSRPAVDRAIMDAGRKSLNQELAQPRVISHEGVEVTGLSAEHGILTLTGDGCDLKIGDRVELMPGYSDWTCVLHNHLIGLRENHVEVIWPLEARGRLQ